MKKVALSLLALALIGAGAFAQDAAAPALKIGGYLDIGAVTTMKADSGNSSGITGDDSGVGGGSYVFKVSYGTDKAGLVTKARLENVTSGNTTTINPQAYYVWFNVPGAEAVKVLGGNYDDDGTAWNMLDDKGDKQTNGTGIAVQVTPSEGFSIGGGVVPQGVHQPFYSVGAAYTVPATVQIAAALKTAEAEKSSNVALSNVAASFKLLLDGPLSAKGGVNLYGLEKDKKTGYNIIDVTLGYALTDAFSVGFQTYVYTYGSDLKYGSDDAAISYKLNPSVAYVVDPITTVGAEMTYGQGGYDKVVKNKLTTIEVKPKATFTIDPNAKVLVYYAYDTQSGDDKNAKDASWSTLSVEFRYNF